MNQSQKPTVCSIVEIRWNWQCKIFILKIRRCKILDKFHVCSSIQSSLPSCPPRWWWLTLNWFLWVWKTWWTWWTWWTRWLDGHDGHYGPPPPHQVPLRCLCRPLLARLRPPRLPARVSPVAGTEHKLCHLFYLQELSFRGNQVENFCPSDGNLYTYFCPSWINRQWNNGLFGTSNLL